MPFEDIKVLEFNQYQISNKSSFIIYPDLMDVKIILKVHPQHK